MTARRAAVLLEDGLDWAAEALATVFEIRRPSSPGSGAIDVVVRRWPPSVEGSSSAGEAALVWALDAGSPAEHACRAQRHTAAPVIAPGLTAEEIGAAVASALALRDERARVEELEQALADAQAHEQDMEREVVHQTQQLVRKVEQLEQFALRDGLTGLFNHKFFQSTVAAEVARAERYGRDLSLVLLDVDDFKSYNDRFGHPQGDELLKALAALIGNSGEQPDLPLRGRLSDLACRYGGEEFALVLPEADLTGACVRAENVRRAIAEHPFPGREQQPQGKVTVSVGVASFPSCARTKGELIAAADQALYRAKHAGRNRVERAPETKP